MEDQGHARNNYGDVENSSGVRERMDLLITNGAQGDDHHVEAIKPRPVLDVVKSRSARKREHDQGDSDDLESAELLHAKQDFTSTAKETYTLPLEPGFGITSPRWTRLWERP